MFLELYFKSTKGYFAQSCQYFSLAIHSGKFRLDSETP